MDSRNFYKELNPVSSFVEVTNASLHVQIPKDWWVVVADVVGSTAAIENGRYKDVNTVGAATIMAVINVDRSTEIPFIFGGDGATLAVPAYMVEGVRKALLGAKQLARDGFNLELRVGMIPVADIYAQDLWLGVVKYQHSKKMVQAALSGFGWGWAENALKDPTISAKYIILESDQIKPSADFTGFECRWKPVKARNGTKLAIIVQCTSRESEVHAEIYDGMLREIDSIYGKIADYHPLLERSLGLTFNPARLMGEALVRANRRDSFSTIGGVLRLMIVSFIGSMAFRFDLKLAGVRWGKYRGEVVENADFRKFDGTLKMVVDGSFQQKRELQNYLESQRKNGLLVYGLHHSAEAIMTCLVLTAGQDHAHFVDGSDGGYAVAAKMLKKQLAEFKSAASG